MGGHYVSTINEPDLSGEYDDRHVPDNWAELAFKNWCNHAQAIQALGGIPLTPALASGVLQARGDNVGQLLDNPFEWIVEAGIEDGTYVIDCHNYVGNHDLRYPYDDVNQLGTPVTLEEYEQHEWLEPMDELNIRRARDKNPGDTIWQDDVGFLAVEVFVELAARAGHTNVGVISGEGGPTYNTANWDARYFKIKHPEMIDMIRGELEYMSKHDWYLCYCWWLYGNSSIGGTGGWYSDQWFQPGADGHDSEGFIQAYRWLVDTPLIDDGTTPDPDPDPPPDPEPPPPPEPDVDNDAESYGVTIVPAAVDPGTLYWKCTRVHHLTQAENNGNHNVFVNVFGLAPGEVAHVRLEWQNGSDRIPLDKPYPAEPMGNAPLWKGQIVSVEVAHELDSDRVDGLSTAHPDEPPGNTLWHHSFLVEWELCTKAGEPEPEPPPEPTEPLGEFIRRMAWDRLYPDGVNRNPAAAFQRVAFQRVLGAPKTNEFRVTYGGVTYAVHGFDCILWTEEGNWGDIREID